MMPDVPRIPADLLRADPDAATETGIPASEADRDVPVRRHLGPVKARRHPAPGPATHTRLLLRLLWGPRP